MEQQLSKASIADGRASSQCWRFPASFKSTLDISGYMLTVEVVATYWLPTALLRIFFLYKYTKQ
jgi:hypothetical protein